MNNDQIFLVTSAELMPRGDGTYILKPHKPEQWLWTHEAARLYRVSPDTIVRWWRLGHIVGRKAGPRRIQIEAASLVAYCSKTEFFPGVGVL